MAQKINPLSFRIGTIQLWNSHLQTYGKLKHSYSSILNGYLNSYEYLNRIFSLSGFLVDHQEWKIGKSSVKLNVYYQTFPYALVQKNFEKILSLLKVLFLGKIFLRLYLKSPWSLSNTLVASYVQYLMSVNTPSKRILLNLKKFLIIHMNSKKISFFKYGIVNLKLTGFKLHISGRIEDSKNQMAKSLEEASGSLPLTSMKRYVVYTKDHIYTKSGVCGLKVWLFYEIY
uniref:Ribosomal protein S3 n=1 Tax=Caulacanthus okamurae TaxID=152008 RepID=A0A6H1U799_9FLOR|nr:ribosomal protein S3 [Caulacanthus okamurae]QIZ74768.1 ribosomal protein S3 [Caulacanthus okamurae]